MFFGERENFQGNKSKRLKYSTKKAIIKKESFPFILKGKNWREKTIKHG